MKRTFFAFNFLILFCAELVFAQNPTEFYISVSNESKTEKVSYAYYIPKLEINQKIPVLVCVGGLLIQGEKSYTENKTCLSQSWKQFSEESKIAILGLGFDFSDQDWEKKRSFQFSKVWSGQALLEILEKLSKENLPIDPNRLYLYGISAGAQFSVRFALWKPEIAKAVAAHAAGGYDLPEKMIPTKFLITVGELDNQDVTRVEMAKEFVKAVKEKGIEIRFEIIPEVGHIQTNFQDDLSKKFFKEIEGS